MQLRGIEQEMYMLDRDDDYTTGINCQILLLHGSFYSMFILFSSLFMDHRHIMTTEMEPNFITSQR